MNELPRIHRKINLRNAIEDIRDVQRKYFVTSVLLNPLLIVSTRLPIRLCLMICMSISMALTHREKMVLNDEEVISHENLSLQAREVFVV